MDIKLSQYGMGSVHVYVCLHGKPVAKILTASEARQLNKYHTDSGWRAGDYCLSFDSEDQAIRAATAASEHPEAYDAIDGVYKVKQVSGEWVPANRLDNQNDTN